MPTIDRLIEHRRLVQSTSTAAFLSVSQWTGIAIALGFAAAVGMIVAVSMMWRKVNDIADCTETLRADVSDVRAQVDEVKSTMRGDRAPEKGR